MGDLCHYCLEHGGDGGDREPTNPFKDTEGSIIHSLLLQFTENHYDPE